MKRIKYIIIQIAVLFGTAACNEILDQMPSNKISGSNMWTTESQADMGVHGVYYSLKFPVHGRTIVGEDRNLGFWAFDVYGMIGQGRYTIDNLFTYSVNPDNVKFSSLWIWCYNGIHRANNAIAYIPDIKNMDEKKKARLVAECKVMRAFFYMILNQLWGNGGLGVPVYLEPVSPAEVNRGQTSEDEVWANVIIKDLTDAINEAELPNHQINGEGRISKGAAYAFRGRAYLITKEYDKAIADFAKVGECGYRLYNGNYKTLFKVAQERCEEMIFSVQFIEEPAGYGDIVMRYMCARQHGAQDYSSAWSDVTVAPAMADLYEVVVDDHTVKPFNWSDFIPEWESVTNVNERKVFFMRDMLVNGVSIPSIHANAVNTELNTLSNAVKAMYLPAGNEARMKAAYANRDPRLAYNIMVPYTDFLGVNSNSTQECWYTFRWPVPGNYFSDQPNSERNLNPNLPADYLPSGNCADFPNLSYFQLKFVGEGLEFSRILDNPIDEPVIRYADVLLMWAEALVEQGDLTGAMAKVKEVRDRAGVPTMTSSFSDKDKARNYVRDERRRELMGEGVNFFDEMRWRTLKETKFDTQFPQLMWGGNKGGTPYQWIGDHYYTWPVPKAEIEMNPNLQRTPGWGY